MTPQAVANDPPEDSRQWRLLCRFNLGTKHPATVTLSTDGAPPGSVVLADAIRFVGPQPVANPPIIPPDFQNATAPP